MNDRSSRLVSLAIVGGGVVWTGWSGYVVVTGRPAGDVSLAVALSGLLLSLGLFGLVFELDWTYQFPGGEGAGIASLGALFFFLGQGMTAVRGADAVATWFVTPGVLAFVGGSLLLGVGLVRARRLPPWVGLGVVLGAVLFLGFTVDHVLALPFGVAWSALGAFLWSHPRRPTEPLEQGGMG